MASYIAIYELSIIRIYDLSVTFRYFVKVQFITFSFQIIIYDIDFINKYHINFNFFVIINFIKWSSIYGPCN